MIALYLADSFHTRESPLSDVSWPNFPLALPSTDCVATPRCVTWWSCNQTPCYPTIPPVPSEGYFYDPLVLFSPCPAIVAIEGNCDAYAWLFLGVVSPSHRAFADGTDSDGH